MAVYLSLAVGILPVLGQSNRPSIEAKFTDRPPVINGRLDEDCWSQAEILTDFTQVLPMEGTPPSEQTEVRFLFDRDSLYIGIRCLDSEPGRIIVRQMRHDSLQESDDTVRLAFDTFDCQHDGYFFALNPAGARTEGLIENFSDENTLWDTVWRVKARIDDRGWTAELAIPFKSLSFDPDKDTWGCNIERIIRRKQETVRWTVLSRTKDMTTLANFGQLRGLSGIRQGIGLEARPFVRLSYRDDDAAENPENDVKLGGDITYYLTPSLKANATILTDFAEAEVDDRIVNLTRFPVLFPEKRDFFLQDSSLFNFGGLGGSPMPYYSRRIGLGDDGQPVDILVGGRLTGRIGNTQVAVLDVQQDSYVEVPSRNLLVGRVTTKVLEESYVGAIVTAGDPQSDGDNALVGADFNYRNTRLARGRQIVGHAWVMGTTSDRMEGEGMAFGGDLDFPNEPLDIHVFLRQIGQRFNPALGFVERRGVREYIGSARYTWRPNTRWLRKVELSGRPSFTTDLDNRVVAEDHDVPILTFTTPADDRLTLETTYYRDVVDEAFEIWPGVTLAPGNYGYWQFKPSFETSPSRPISAGFNFRQGHYYSGHRTDYNPFFDWHPSRHLTLGVSYEFRRIRLLEGDFDVRIARGQLTMAATPDLAWDTILQYDNLSDNLGLHTRIRWTYRPGSDLFVVLHRESDYHDDPWRSRLSELMLKVTATLRF